MTSINLTVKHRVLTMNEDVGIPKKDVNIPQKKDVNIPQKKMSIYFKIKMYITGHIINCLVNNIMLYFDISKPYIHYRN